MTIGPFFTYQRPRSWQYPAAKPSGPYHLGVRRCVACNGILWRRERLLTSPLPSHFHHACMHRQLVAFSAKTNFEITRCFICGNHP
jgi:hypothetical protein